MIDVDIQSDQSVTILVECVWLEEFGDWNALSPLGGVQEQNFKHVIEEVGMVATRTDTVRREVHLQ